MTETSRRLRIGEVAARTGTTPRTIRYYEEIGLLPTPGERASGTHRMYDESDVVRLQEVLRLKELLGVSLDELRELIAAELARAALRTEWHTGAPGVGRQREILQEALRLAERQLELVVRRREEIGRLEVELQDKLRRLRSRLAELAGAGETDAGERDAARERDDDVPARARADAADAARVAPAARG